MADLQLKIDLVPPQDVYHPGEQLRGTVSITSVDGPWKANSAELVVFWRTSGIGTSDTGIGASLSLGEKGTEFPSHFTREFELTLPLQPYSYNGTLVKIKWFVAVRLKKGLLSKQEYELPIELRPAGVLLGS